MSFLFYRLSSFLRSFKSLRFFLVLMLSSVLRFIFIWVCLHFWEGLHFWGNSFLWLSQFLSSSLVLRSSSQFRSPSSFLLWGKLFSWTVPPNNTLHGKKVPPNRTLFVRQTIFYINRKLLTLKLQQSWIISRILRASKLFMEKVIWDSCRIWLLHLLI